MFRTKPVLEISLLTGTLPDVVSRAEWLAVRKELLVKEKELTRAVDRVNADRRRLPMVRIDKSYTFDGPDGQVGLLDLFDGRPQLVMHHFMFDPAWDDMCPSCASAADGIGGLKQLHMRNTTLVAAGVHKPFNVMDLPAGHRIENCYVHHIGLDEKHVAGVSLAGVGNELAHCLIHDCPRWGIHSRGSHQIIEYNHVRHVNIETADTAGIYTCDRDLTMMGSIIRYNRVHDILGYEKTDDGWRFPSYAFGIYLDDWTSHVTVHGNLTYNTPRGGIYLNSGQANTITNNCCLAGRRELAYYNRWSAELEQSRIGTYGQGLRRNRIERNIFVGNGESEVLYSFGRNLTDSGEVDIESNIWARNIVWNGNRVIVIRASNGQESREYSWQAWQALGQDQESQVVDPRLDEAFGLADDSPAIGLGFEPLPIASMGLQRSSQRRNWPPPEAIGIRESMQRELLRAGHAR